MTTPPNESMKQAKVEVGQRYTAWGKTFEVTKVWPLGVVEGIEVGKPGSSIRWPLKQFKEFDRA